MNLSRRDYLAATLDLGATDELSPKMGSYLLGRECPYWETHPRDFFQWWADYRAALRYMEADAMIRASDSRPKDAHRDL